VVAAAAVSSSPSPAGRAAASIAASQAGGMGGSSSAASSSSERRGCGPHPRPREPISHNNHKKIITIARTDRALAHRQGAAAGGAVGRAGGCAGARGERAGAANQYLRPGHLGALELTGGTGACTHGVGRVGTHGRGGRRAGA
jgi:hypothetical protein